MNPRAMGPPLVPAALAAAVAVLLAAPRFARADDASEAEPSPPAARKGSPDNAGPLPIIPDFDDSFEEAIVEHSWSEGLAIAVGLRGASFVATDCCQLRGTGGAASLRLSTVMSPRFRWVLRFDVGGIAVRESDRMIGDRLPGNRDDDDDDESDGNDITLNQQVVTTLGLQAMRLGPAWLETGLGFATYRLRRADQTVPEGNLEGNGFALVSAVGADVLRVRRVRLAVEFTFLGSLYTRIGGERSSGLIAQFGFGVSASFGN